jgi:DNA-binding CsgD family transcriptional regulator
MLDRRLDDSIRHGREAEALAARLGDRAVELHARITVGSDLLFAGRMDEGWAALDNAIHGALEGDRDEEAARAWRMAGSCASVLVEYDRAERYLESGIEHAERSELWNHRHYMAAHLAHVRWATGHWNEAETLAEHVLADGRGGITTRITALHVLGFVALGRGDDGQARAFLEEARAIGASMRELQRESPAVWGLAELDLVRGDVAGAIDRSEEGRAGSAAVDDAAYLFPFLVTGTRARLEAGDVGAADRWVRDVSERLRARSIPGTLPAIDHAEGLVLLAGGSLGRAQQSIDAAVTGWTTLRRMPDRIAAMVDAAACHLRAGRAVAAVEGAAQALAEATALGAVPHVERARTILEAARARHPDASAWAPLTSREFEVARLVADGHTNASIAAELGITARTVGAHIEHIFAKLGVGRRAEVAAWTASRALAPILRQPPKSGNERLASRGPGVTGAGGPGRPSM